MPKVVVIGSGFSSLSASAHIAARGHEVTVLEQNDTLGGRARKFEAEGFTFDMGPSWYWMPDVFERFYNQFGYTTEDFYELVRLNPSYKVFWEDDTDTNIPASLEEFFELFEQWEPGSSSKLKEFLNEAEYKYQVGINDLVYKPGASLTEFMDTRIMKGVFKMHLLKSFSKYIRKYFKHPKILQLLEFPVLFLGATPQDTPALYSLMNYADIKLGTWYPKGGMHKIVEAMSNIAIERGVHFETGSAVESILCNNNQITTVATGKNIFEPDVLVSGADYHHTEQLLSKRHRNYDDKYWDTREMAPSCLIYYVGVNKKLDGLEHHNLFFDAPFDPHAQEIYKTKTWPKNPLFYVSATSKTDNDVAPEGCENLFILIPVAPGLRDTEDIKARYFDMVMDRLEKKLGTSIKDNVVYKKEYAYSNFVKDYNAFKGNAYGLANTLKQTALLKPKMHNKHVNNLFYTGQLTVPGPGVPPAIISGEVAANEVKKHLKKFNYESAI